MIALAATVCAAAAVGFSFFQTPVYEASIKILVRQEQEADGPSNLGGDVQGLQQLTQTVAEAVNTRPVADAVKRRLNLRITSEEFLENLNVEQVGSTQFIEVSYKDPDPQGAQRIANAIGEEVSEQVSQVNPIANAITATVWERAVVPDAPVSPNPVRNGLLALVIGGMLGLGLAFLMEYLDNGRRPPEEVEQVLKGRSAEQG